MKAKDIVVAYEGVELSYQSIVNALEIIDSTHDKSIVWTNDKRKCAIHKNTSNNNRILECAHVDYTVLAKVSDKTDDVDGIFFDSTFKVLSMCQCEGRMDSTNDIQQKFNYGYSIKSLDVFNELESDIDFLGVIYDGLTDCIFINNQSEEKLYYGSTRENQEIIVSNSADFLKCFCDSLSPLMQNVCMKDNSIFPLDECKTNNPAGKQFIKKAI